VTTGPLTLDDIADLRAYERERDALLADVIALKRIRRIGLGPIVSVVLENRTTIRFQVQEMVRAERMLEDAQVQEELDVYNPLIPSPGELSMTLFLELTSEAALREWLPKLVGIERAVVLQIGLGEDALVLRDEVDAAHAAQLTREQATSAVHFVRVKVPESAWARFEAEPVVLRIDHPAYQHEAELSPATKASVIADWVD
jgi:hypothetical protein